MNKNMKGIALLWSLYTITISFVLIVLGWIVGFVGIPFAAGFDKGQEHHKQLLEYLRKFLK